MKVTHVINDLETGGAQTLIEALAKGLGRQVAISVVVLGSRGALSDRLEHVVKKVDYLHFSRTSSNVLKLVDRVNEAIESQQPDIIHTHLLQSDLAVGLSRLPRHVPTISTMHTSGLAHTDPLRSRAVARVMPIITRRFKATVACTPSSERLARRMGYPTKRLKLIENGVHLGPKRSHERTCSILSLSRWHPMKDHETLFAAFSILLDTYPSVRLICAGTGVDPENQHLRELLNRFDVADNVQLLGPASNVDKLLWSTDALVISSRYGEALPMAGLEALASSTPVVSTDVGDTKALVVRPSQLSRPGDPRALATSIGSIYELSDEAYAGVCEDAYALGKARFDANRVVHQYLEIYDLIESASRSARVA